MLKEGHGNLTNAQILRLIEEDTSCKNYTFIILGRTGPTGKSWLRNELTKRGYNAFEISEDIIRVDSMCFANDRKNHVMVSNKTVTIILNQILTKYAEWDNK